MAKQFQTMGGRRSRYWCGPGIFRETEKAPVRGFIGQRSAPAFFSGTRPPRSRSSLNPNGSQHEKGNERRTEDERRHRENARIPARDWPEIGVPNNRKT